VDTIRLDTPCEQTILDLYNSASSGLLYVVLTVMKWATLVSQSIITQRESSPDWVLGNPTMKSIAISSHFCSGICKGYNNSAGHWCLASTLWHVSQKSNIFTNISLHSVPPIGCLEIMLHLIPSWMNGISGIVSLLMYLILQFLDVSHIDPFFVP
jgi:hypothetical protein